MGVAFIVILVLCFILLKLVWNTSSSSNDNNTTYSSQYQYHPRVLENYGLEPKVLLSNREKTCFKRIVESLPK